MSRTFTRIKRSQQGAKDDRHWVYELEWHDTKAPAHEHALRTRQEPVEQFLAALNSLVPYVCAALDLPPTYGDPHENGTQCVVVRQVRWEDEGVRIGAVKELSCGEVVSLPMPLISSTSVEGSPELAAVLEEAGIFADGIRLQLDLFRHEEVREQSDVVGVILDLAAEEINSGAHDTGKTTMRAEVRRG